MTGKEYKKQTPHPIPLNLWKKDIFAKGVTLTRLRDALEFKKTPPGPAPGDQGAVWTFKPEVNTPARRKIRAFTADANAVRSRALHIMAVHQLKAASAIGGRGKAPVVCFWKKGGATVFLKRFASKTATAAEHYQVSND